MDKINQCGLLLIFLLILSLGLVSFISCLLAEFNKAKKEDVRLDNKECYVGESKAFWYGVAAITSLVAAQCVGNLVICAKFWMNTSKPNHKRPTKFGIAFWVLSWISCGGGMIILSGATSMSREQAYGKGWFEGDCYLVRDGFFSSSSFLVLLTIASTFASLTLTVLQPP